MSEKASAVRQLMFKTVEGIREAVTAKLSPEEAKQTFSLTVSQARVFTRVRTLEENSGKAISLKTLARDLGISPAAASEAVEVLVNKGALCRKRSEKDRRAVEIAVSEMAREVTHKRQKECDVFVAAGLEGFSAEEKSSFVELLNKFYNGLVGKKVI